MRITEHPRSDSLELRFVGRLDATWANHVSEAIERAVRAGSHRLLLNFARVEYISSMGIGVLLEHYQELRSVNGSLSLIEPSAQVREVLEAAGLGEVLLGAAAAAPVVAIGLGPVELTRGGAIYQSYPQADADPLSCQMIGRPERLADSGFDGSCCRAVRLGGGTFGLGIGAFGDGFEDCRERFGEFLAAGGCAITLPTNDPHARPDYIIEEGELDPTVETLYGLVGEGDFATMVRFDATPEGPGKVPLSELAETLVELSGGTSTAFVVLAEAEGVVGATLRRSPATGPVSFELPGVRDWLSFTTERAGERCLVLLVGVATADAPAAAAAFLRPLTAGSAVQAHVHAAVFPYRPVQRGELPFGRTVAELVAASAPRAVMHLMADTRPFEGLGETDLVRGACWIGPLTTISSG